MSIKAMSIVLAADIPPNEKFVAVCLADHGDDHGQEIYPSLDYLSWKTGYSKKNLRRIVARLITRGILVNKETQRGKPQFSLLLQKMNPRPRKKTGTRCPSAKGQDVPRKGTRCPSVGTSCPEKAVPTYREPSLNHKPITKEQNPAFDSVLKAILEVYPPEAVPSQQAAAHALRKIPAADHPAVILAAQNYSARVRDEQTDLRFVKRLGNFLSADFWRGHTRPLGGSAKSVPDFSWKTRYEEDLRKALERVERKKREAAEREGVSA